MAYDASSWEGGYWPGVKGPGALRHSQYSSPVWTQQQPEMLEPTLRWPMVYTQPSEQQGMWWNNDGWWLLIPSTRSDAHREGQLSDRLQDTLQFYDVVAIGEILKSRHITTVQDLTTMKFRTKADIHSAAQFMYTKILGAVYWTDRRKKNMEAIFYMPQTYISAASSLWDQKPKETELKREVQRLDFMGAGCEWFGQEKMMECQHLMNQSESLARLSVTLLAQAYLALILPEHLKPVKWRELNGSWVEAEEFTDFKALRATIRDGIVWRMIGFMLGMDCREAAESILNDVFQDYTENPDEDSPYSATLHAFVLIKRDALRAILTVEARTEKLRRAAGLEEQTDVTLPVHAGDVTKEFLQIKSWVLKLQDSIANLQTDVNHIKTSRASTAEDSQ